MTARRRVLVGGRVQGVFFRDTCARMAYQTGVAGWVRNHPDGRVEACFEGEPDAVERMVAWCRKGPSRAYVETVEIVDEAPVGESGFRVQ
jgi:acylphosphatase